VHTSKREHPHAIVLIPAPTRNGALRPRLPQRRVRPSSPGMPGRVGRGPFLGNWHVRSMSKCRTYMSP